MRDHDTITAVVHRLGWLADTRQWNELATIFTDRVRLDYTALTGGEPATLAPTDIVAGWKAGLGGLDGTQHLIAGVVITVDADTAQFQATHVLDNPHGDRHWVLGGHYHIDLIRSGQNWLISALTMTPTWSTGNRGIMELATARPRDAATAAQEFLQGLEALDIDAALAVFADDAVQEMPYAPEGFPDRLDGIAALRRQYGGLPDAYRSMRFPIRRIIAHGDTAVVEYRGQIELRGGGRYDNDYVGIFEVRDGRIVRFIERFDPTVLSTAFGDTIAHTFTIANDDR